MPRRSAFGPRSRNRAGSHVSQRCGGSTTWSSTLMILGKSACTHAPGRNLTRRQILRLALQNEPKGGSAAGGERSSGRCDGRRDVHVVRGRTGTVLHPRAATARV